MNFVLAVRQMDLKNIAHNGQVFVPCGAATKRHNSISAVPFGTKTLLSEGRFRPKRV